MNFLGLYNLIMALAVAGACGVCDPNVTQDYDGPAYMAQGDQLPPVGSIIDHPPTVIDSGYWGAFYWNHPHDGDADNGDDDRDADRRWDDDEGYAAPPYGPAAAADDRGYAAALRGADLGGYDESRTDFRQRQVYYPSDRERRDARRRQDRKRRHAVPAAADAKGKPDSQQQ